MPRPAGQSAPSETITLRVPMTFRRRGGRKVLVAPTGSPAMPPTRTRIDSALVRAVVRAFRWRKLIEVGEHPSIREIADAEKITPSYVSRVLAITLLAPDLVEAILNGRQPSGLTLPALVKALPREWERQRRQLEAR